MQNVGGISFQIQKDQGNATYYPAIPFFIGDNKELCTLSGVRHGPKTKRQCRICKLENSGMHIFADPQEQAMRSRSQVVEAMQHLNHKELLKDLSVSASISSVST